MLLLIFKNDGNKLRARPTGIKETLDEQTTSEW